MRKVIGMVLVSLMGAAGGFAGPVPGMEKWAGGNATNALRSVGVTNAASIEAIAKGWDENVIVNTAISENALGLIAVLMEQSPAVSEENLQKIKAALLSADKLPANVVGMMKRFPNEGDRRELLTIFNTPPLFRAPPAGSFLDTKYAVLWNLSFPPQASKVDPLHLTECMNDILGELLSPAPASLEKVTVYKNAIKDLAAVKARLKLASEGKSFVMRNKVNPIAVAVQPVVDALNAPECDGLEAALAWLGMTVNAIDRSALDEAVEADTTDILAGLLVGEAAVAKLGKIEVAMGVIEYNRLVSTYNGEPESK